MPANAPTQGSDERFMREALLQADAAAALNEVPVGAVVVLEGAIVGRGHNQQIATHDPSAHAELVAIRAASAAVANYRLSEATLYSTIEPCTMCLGACVHARIARIVYGAPEPRAGAIDLLQATARPGKRYNHMPIVEAGCLGQECGDKLRQFFRAKRDSA